MNDPFRKNMRKNKHERLTKKEERELFQNIQQAKTETENLAQAINFTNDSLMLENLIYELKASELRYRHFLSEARAHCSEVHHLDSHSITETE